MARKFVVGGKRSGRFNFKTAPASNVILSQGFPSTLYRVLNSGDNPFTVNGGGDDATVAKKGCIDLFVDDELLLKPAAEIQGIYDIITASFDGHSGRFNYGPEANPGDLYLFLDLMQCPSGRTHVYRVFNTGDQALEIHKANPSSAAWQTLAPNQSADIQFSGKLKYYVKGPDLGSGKAAPISGVYDLLR